VWWLLGDPMFDSARSRIESVRHCPRPASTALPTTGYYVSRNDHGDQVIIDGGPHGYLNGGHAHSDALAVTFISRGRPCLIDTGTGSYTAHPEIRDRFRSTDLHNTVTLNGRGQSVASGPFHWRHTADAAARHWRTNRHFDYFAGTHDGYAPVTHHRHVLMLHGDLLIVADCITHSPQAEQKPSPGAIASLTPSTDIHAAAHWHLDPGWIVAPVGGSSALLTSANRPADGRNRPDQSTSFRDTHNQSIDTID
jgi:uncharacterized heparinase superfamily protein